MSPIIQEMKDRVTKEIIGDVNKFHLVIYITADQISVTVRGVFNPLIYQINY